MTIEFAKSFLMWSSIINMSLMIIWALFVTAIPNTVYRMQTKFFDIKRDSFDTVIYLFFGIYKLLIIFFNIIPWIVLEIIGQ
ncbi:DUF6868 family protein [Candidatus Albibeggiatoa sp. nov. NOAA]|uniref:DUF6868 family protein n=1 Tax=Candidatus Albibeggiatoa sp. nov. NOAA TaxID=3162724 RepID=UPI003341F384